MNIKKLEEIVLAIADENTDQHNEIKSLNERIDFLTNKLLEFQNELSKTNKGRK